MPGPPPVSPLEGLDRIARGGPPPVVVYAGEESFLAEEGIAAVVRRVFPEGEPGGALVALDASNPADAERAAAVLEDLHTPSLFGEGKVVVIRRAEALGGAAAAVGDDDPEATEGEEAAGEEPEEPPPRAVPAGKAKTPGAKPTRRASPITSLVKESTAKAAPGSVLVLATDKPVRGRGSVSAEAITKTGALLVDCRRLYDSVPPWSRGTPAHDTEVARWVARRAKESHGKAMDPRAAHALSVRVGASLAPLARTLETLATYVGARPAITEADVAATVSATREDPAWVLADAVLDRDLPRALSLAAAAFDRGLSDAKGRVAVRPEAVYPMLFATVHAAWRRAMLVAEAATRGEDPTALPALAGLPSFVVERVVRQAGRRSPDDLLTRHGALVAAEAGVRGGGVPHRAAFERMLVDLILVDRAG